MPNNIHPAILLPVLEDMEVTVFGPEPLIDSLDHIITLDGICLASILSVKNLGVTYTLQ